jgi:tetratricopeptide (TPR) repeat protein
MTKEPANAEAAQASVVTMPTRPTFGQLWQVPLFLVGALALLGVWLTKPYWYDPEGQQAQRCLDHARELLQDPEAALNAVPDQLLVALKHLDRYPARKGEAHFLLGSVYLRLADALPSVRTQELRHEARKHLEWAEVLGVPAPDRPVLKYRVAKAWFQTGADPHKVILYLLESLEQIPDSRVEGYAMLTETYLALPQPDLHAALKANERLLQLPEADETQLTPARLLRGEILMQLHERDAARKVLARIGSNAPPLLRSRARHLRARSFQEEEAWAEAAVVWNAILADPQEPAGERGPVYYYLGWCDRNLHHVAAAASWWEQAVARGGEYGQAAALCLADLRLELGDRAPVPALVKQALARVTRPEEYHNGLVDLVYARRVLENAVRAFQAVDNFAEAEELALLFPRVAPAETAYVQLGRILDAWAKRLAEQLAQTKDPASVPNQRAAIEACYRDAALAFDGAAEAAASAATKFDFYFHAAQDYAQGQDFNHAITALEQVLKLNPPLERQNEIWYRLGEAHQALHHTDAAAKAFRNCIGGNGPFAFRARYQLSLMDKPADAEAALLQNLDLMRLEPDREAEEKTLYRLAYLLYQRGDYRMAAQRWEQALRDYPANAGANLARYRLGDCYRQLAELENRNRGPSAPFRDVTDGHHYKQYVYWQKKAEANYLKLVDDLEALQAARGLAEADATMLRQARFALADCEFDSGNFDEAIRLYNNLARQYQNQVDGLRAVRSLYQCFVVRIPPDPINAHATLQRAREMLNNLDDNAFAGQPPSQGRAAWEMWLREQSKSLAP